MKAVANAAGPKIHATGDTKVSLARSGPHRLKPARSMALPIMKPKGSATNSEAVAATAKRAEPSRTSAGTANSSAATVARMRPTRLPAVSPAVAQCQRSGSTGRRNPKASRGAAPDNTQAKYAAQAILKRPSVTGTFLKQVLIKCFIEFLRVEQRSQCLGVAPLATLRSCVHLAASGMWCSSRLSARARFGAEALP